MPIKRYKSEADTTISNAFEENLNIRITGSNQGMSDSCEIFKIYAQSNATSSELSRALFKFPISSISSDRTSKIIPSSASVDFYMRLYNAEHPFTVPQKITLSICPMSQSWDEGYGKNPEDDGICNWTQAYSNSSGITNWTTQGGDYYTASYVPGSTLPTYSYYMEEGTEDVSLNMTSLVEEWIAGTKSNYGVMVKLEDNTENALSSSYTKRFFTRGSEYHFKRPCIEARWDDSKKDSRNNFYASSSLFDSENVNTLYLYNYARGQLRNIAALGTGAIYVRFYTDNISGSLINNTPVTGGYYDVGIYTASVALDTTASYVYDRWYGANLTTCYHTGSRITVKSPSAFNYNPNSKYILSMPNLKSVYSDEENIRLDVGIKQKNWSPNKYSVMNNTSEVQYIEDLYYNVVRSTDKLEVVEFGTGSINNTRLSYDCSGSYFNFDFGLLEKDYMYEFHFVMKKDTNNFEKLPEKFKFRVE